jgi:hypothetical protein
MTIAGWLTPGRVFMTHECDGRVQYQRHEPSCQLQGCKLRYTPSSDGSEWG